jgi:two-component system, chemotaxis family, protein-glutamate methylesterase/glutaminase
MTESPRYIIVIGASAGGLHAIKEFIGSIQKGWNAAVCITIHLSVNNLGGFIVNQLQQNASLPCSLAEDDTMLKEDHIYLAPPDRHIFIKENKIYLGKGAKENRWRPSIDVLFRSAAIHFNSNAAGIILSGLLNDGVSGMSAIQRSGGLCIIQDPEEAEYPDMPRAVLADMEVDHILKLDEIGNVLQKFVGQERQKVDPPRDVVAENNIAEKVAVGIDLLKDIGEKSIYTCPDCGGGLWELKEGGVTRYRCHVGHSFSERDLLLKQTESLETSLWVAVRMMEERRNLLLKMRDDNLQKKRMRMAADNNEQAEQMLVHINKLKEAIFDTQPIMRASAEGE